MNYLHRFKFPVGPNYSSRSTHERLFCAALHFPAQTISGLHPHSRVPWSVEMKEHYGVYRQSGDQETAAEKGARALNAQCRLVAKRGQSVPRADSYIVVESYEKVDR